MLTERDLKYLKILSILHYVYGGISVVFSLLPLIYIGIGILALCVAPGDANGEVPKVFACFLIALGAVVMIMGLTVSALIIFAGRSLSKRKRWIFCFVVACLECIFIPFGTILGIISIMLLLKASVKEGFQQEF